MLWDYGRPSGRWGIWVSGDTISSSFFFKKKIYFSGRAGYGASLEGMVSIITYT
jgi:hypothetical protein